MAGEILDYVVAPGREFGVCRMARAVGLDCTALRKKVARVFRSP